MPFSVFQEKCEEIVRKSGIPCNVKYSNEDGKYIARFGDVTIKGNSVSLRVGVYWGSGHKAMAAI